MSLADAASPSSRGKIKSDDGLIGTPYAPESNGGWPGSWTGLYVGLGVGTMAGLANLEGAHGPLLEGVGAWGWVGDVKVGYDYRFPQSPFVIGLFGGYSLGGVEISGGFGEEASITPTWNVGVRGGLVAWNSSLIYVGYAYNRADLDVPFGDGPGTIGGHTLLGGVEMPVSKAVTMALEYGFTQWDAFDVNGVDVDPVDHRVMLRANLRFGLGN